jgi:hypothetical protein
MHALTKLRKKYEHQKLMALCARFDSWMTIPLVCTMFLFMGFAFADTCEAKVLRLVFMASGFVALSITLFFFVCWAFFGALDSILYTRSRGLWRILSVGFWFMLAFCIALFVLTATGILAREKFGLSSLFGRIIVGYVAFYMALLGSVAVQVARDEFREWHSRRSVRAFLLPAIFGGLLWSGSAWIFWRILLS